VAVAIPYTLANQPVNVPVITALASATYQPTYKEQAMLNTINGFDLLLVIVITLLVFKVIRLNEECNDYVRQIVEVSQDNYELTKLNNLLNLQAEQWQPPF
jgi:hypothetical protein